MIFEVVGKRRHDSSETCSICLKFIGAGQVYVRAESQTAHYRCAKKRKWKKAPRKQIERIKREIAPPRIRVVKRKVL